jgi:hypothetical protein
MSREKLLRARFCKTAATIRKYISSSSLYLHVEGVMSLSGELQAILIEAHYILFRSSKTMHGQNLQKASTCFLPNVSSTHHSQPFDLPLKDHRPKNFFIT